MITVEKGVENPIEKSMGNIPKKYWRIKDMIRINNPKKFPTIPTESFIWLFQREFPWLSIVENHKVIS